MKYHFKIGAVLINKDGKILLQEEYSPKKKGYFYNIIKGTVDNTDVSIKQALFREIYEESGLTEGDILSYDVYKSYVSEKDTYVSILITFLVYLDKDIEEKITNSNTTENEDIRSHQWLSLKEINNLDVNQFFDIRIFMLFKDIIKNNE